MDIESVLRGHGMAGLRVELERLGVSIRGNRCQCPLEGCRDKGEKRDRDAQIFGGDKAKIWCFACEHGADLLDLVQLSRGLSKKDAIDALGGGSMLSAPRLRVVPPKTRPPEEGKLSPGEVRRIWDSMAKSNPESEAYLERRGLGDATQLGLVRFAVEGEGDSATQTYARRGYRVGALLQDVTGNARGIQYRATRETTAKEAKILSLRGSSTSRAFFGEAGEIEASSVVAVAEGLADTIALQIWTHARPGVVVVGAAGKGSLVRLAEELGEAGISVEGRTFVLFPQNDRPRNVSRREFVRLAQALKKGGASVVFVRTPDEHKDLSDWRLSEPDGQWPPPELAKATQGQEEEEHEEAPVLSADSAVPVPGRVTVETHRQDFSTLCALIDDPLTQDAVLGKGGLTWCEMSGVAKVGERKIREHDLSGIRLALESQGRTAEGRPLKFSTLDIAQAVSLLARRKSVHPVRAYLSGLRWDGRERIELELPELLGQEVAGFPARLLFRWMISAVARAMEPGCKCDTVLVLVGPQGNRKSGLFDVLGGEWFTDSPVQVGDKDGMMALRERWIVEWAELDSMRRARDQEAIKAFLASRVDFFRAPYARGLVESPRHSVVVGTTNNEQFLADSTGNRRFWPVRVARRVDLGWVREHRDQLWAEAAGAYRRGDQWWLTDEEEGFLVGEHKAHEIEDAWAPIVRDWLSERPAKTRVTTTEILVDALAHRVEQVGPGQAVRVGRVMASLGWSKVRARTEQGRAWVYERPEVADDVV